MATIDKVSVDITVMLGTTVMPVHQVLRLGRGAIIERDAARARRALAQDPEMWEPVFGRDHAQSFIKQVSASFAGLVAHSPICYIERRPRDATACHGVSSFS